MSVTSLATARASVLLMLTALLLAGCSAKRPVAVSEPPPNPVAPPPPPVDVSRGVPSSLSDASSSDTVRSAIDRRLASRLEHDVELPPFPTPPAPPPESSPLDEIADLDLYSIEVDPALEDRADRQLKQQRFDIPVVLNQEVLRFLEYYQNRGREGIIKGLERSARHMPLYREAFARHDVPLDLIYMAHVESLFNPLAYSRAHAKGTWQFVAGTARLYGLKIDWWLDERSDIAKSTDASARYLRDLYEEFGDWYLALAGYNGGPGRVRRALRRGGASDYWRLSRKRLLPRDTRNYVPSILAAIIIYKDPDHFGFASPPQEPVEFEQLAIPFQVDLRVVAETTRLNLDDLMALNPELRRGITPADDSYRLKVPSGTASAIDRQLAALPAEKRLKLKHHRVRRGETLSHIASRYGVTIRAIADTNRIRNVNRLSLGQNLIIPISGWVPSRALEARSASQNRPRSYTVRRGDSPYSIARRFGIRVGDLLRWNGLTSRSLIHPGQRLSLLSRR